MIVLISALVIGGFLLKPSDATVYESSEEEISTPEVVQPSVPQEWLDEAEKAKEDVLRKRQLEADRDAALQNLKDAQEKLDLIEKELGF